MAMGDEDTPWTGMAQRCEGVRDVSGSIHDEALARLPARNDVGIGTEGTKHESIDLDFFSSHNDVHSSPFLSDVSPSISPLTASQKVHLRRCASSFVIAAYVYVPLIPQDSRALHLELFAMPSTVATFYEVITADMSSTA